MDKDMDKIGELLFELMKLKELYNVKNGKSKNYTTAFETSIIITPIGLSCGINYNQTLVEEFGLEEWLKETKDVLAPIVEQQEIELSKILSEKFGVKFASFEKSEEYVKTANEIFGK